MKDLPLASLRGCRYADVLLSDALHPICGLPSAELFILWKFNYPIRVLVERHCSPLDGRRTLPHGRIFDFDA